jgi:peptidoglycan-associated lipoprotein
MTRLTVVPIAVATALVGAACHHKVPPAPMRTAAPATTTSTAPRTPPPPAAARTPAAVSSSLSEDEQFRRLSLDELNRQHPLNDVFFDYDQNVIKDEGRTILQRDAQWLAKWPQTNIVVEGYCDERGSSEYNLALGERRAVVVRDYLTSLGVKTDRVVTRSLGKEAPFCHDAGEACWSKNRRGHFVISAK